MDVFVIVDGDEGIVLGAALDVLTAIEAAEREHRLAYEELDGWIPPDDYPHGVRFAVAPAPVGDHIGHRALADGVADPEGLAVTMYDGEKGSDGEKGELYPYGTSIVVRLTLTGS